MTFAKELRGLIEQANSGSYDESDCQMEILYLLEDHAEAIADLCETVSLYVNKINAPADHPLRVALGKLEGL